MRLKQHLGAGEIQFIDVREPGALEQVVAAQPGTVIVDAGDPGLEIYCPLNKLLDAMPALRIIRLDLQHAQIQVVTSEQRAVTGVSDLIEVLRNPSAPA